jgi:hypothetical protein
MYEEKVIEEYMKAGFCFGRDLNSISRKRECPNFKKNLSLLKKMEETIAKENYKPILLKYFKINEKKAKIYPIKLKPKEKPIFHAKIFSEKIIEHNNKFYVAFC